MSKKYLTGSKRLQVIQRWLNGVDDPEYDVFPTRKEGKYIVKPRNETIKQTTKEVNDLHSKTLSLESEEPNEKTEQEPIEPEQSLQPKITPKPKQIPKPKFRQQTNINDQSYDPTINIEILNQLKLLGEEFKLKREKKEQKRMIKEVVQKQIAKPRMQYNYTEPDYEQLPISIGNSLDKVKPNQDEEMIEQSQTTLTRRRNNIFADIM